MVRVVINGWSSGGSNNSGSGDGGVAIMVVVVVFVCINVYKLIIFRYLCPTAAYKDPCLFIFWTPI